MRTVRFYDRVGLLQPSARTEAGYRLYTEADFLRLQQILALKFLGFSLEEIRYCLQVGPTSLKEALALQKAMMCEKRAQLNAVIQAIAETEALLDGNGHDWEAIVHVIQVMHMEQTNDWRKKYFTDEQLKQMEDLSKQSYSEEAQAKLAEWGKNWSEADQERANQQWGALIGELKRLVAERRRPHRARGAGAGRAMDGDGRAVHTRRRGGDGGLEEDDGGQHARGNALSALLWQGGGHVPRKNAGDVSRAPGPAVTLCLAARKGGGGICSAAFQAAKRDVAGKAAPPGATVAGANRLAAKMAALQGLPCPTGFCEAL